MLYFDQDDYQGTSHHPAHSPLLANLDTLLIAGGLIAISDPGDGLAIPVTASGECALTAGAGVETRTLANPTAPGQTLRLTLAVTGGGTIAVTAAAAINQTGDTTITFPAAAGATVLLQGRTVGSAYRWTVVHPDGVTLT